MRQLDVEAARGAKDGLARADVDLAIVDEEGLGLLFRRRALARDGVRDASICGLGQAASNPLVCVMKYFPDELAKPLGRW